MRQVLLHCICSFQDSLTSKDKRLKHDNIRSHLDPIENLERASSESNFSSNSSSSSSTYIQQNVNLNSSDNEDQLSGNTEIEPNSEILYQTEGTQHSLQPESEFQSNRDSDSILNVPHTSSEHRVSPDRESDQSLTVSVIPINIDQPSNQFESSSDYKIITFHSIAGKIESFGTSIFITMKGEVDE